MSVADNQLIPTQFGLMRIFDLHIMDKALNLSGGDSIVYASPIYMDLQKTNLLRINTADGYQLIVTPDQLVKIYASNLEQAKNLKIDDKLALYSSKHLPGDFDGDGKVGGRDFLALQRNPSLGNMSDWEENYGKFGITTPLEGIWCTGEDYQKEAFLAGLLYANGNLDDGYYAEFAYELLDRIQSMTPIVLKRFGLSQDAIFAKVAKGRMCLKSKNLLTVLQQLYCCPITGIPQFVLRSNRQTIIAFLKSLYYANAIIESSSSCALVSNNEKLLQEVQIVLINFGIKTSRNEQRLAHTSIQSSKMIEELILLGAHKKNQGFIDNAKQENQQQELWATITNIENIQGNAYTLNVYNNNPTWSCNGFLIG